MRSILFSKVISLKFGVIRYKYQRSYLHGIKIIEIAFPLWAVKGLSEQLKGICMMKSIMISRSDHKDQFAGYDLDVLKHIYIQLPLQIISQISSKHNHYYI